MYKYLAIDITMKNGYGYWFKFEAESFEIKDNGNYAYDDNNKLVAFIPFGMAIRRINKDHE